MISVSAVMIAIVVSFLAAYCFSRYQPRSTNFLMFLLLSMRMIPAAAVVGCRVPHVRGLWLERHLARHDHVLRHVQHPLLGLDPEGLRGRRLSRFDQNRLINGGSRLHVLFNVVLPQVRPGLIAAFIFNFVFVWNEFLFNYLIGGKQTTMVPVALSTWMYAAGRDGLDVRRGPNLIYMLLPIAVVFFFQKYLLTGMTFGTVRGEV